MGSKSKGELRDGVEGTEEETATNASASSSRRKSVTIAEPSESETKEVEIVEEEVAVSTKPSSRKSLVQSKSSNNGMEEKGTVDDNHAVEETTISESASKKSQSVTNQNPSAAEIETDDQSASKVVSKVQSSAINESNQATRSYVFSDTEGSMLYEKDGEFVLEKFPDIIDGSKTFITKFAKPTPSVLPETAAAVANQSTAEASLKDENANVDPCCRKFEPYMVKLDSWTSNETIPCNQCDKSDIGYDIAPLWTWMYNMVSQAVVKLNEMKREFGVRDVSCGETPARSDEFTVDENLVSSKSQQT